VKRKRENKWNEERTQNRYRTKELGKECQKIILWAARTTSAMTVHGVEAKLGTMTKRGRREGIIVGQPYPTPLSYELDIFGKEEFGR
jgi:hypothetical protein